MRLDELADRLEGINAGLEQRIIDRGGTPMTDDTAGIVAIALGILLLWWVIAHKPDGKIAFVFGALLWGLLIVEGFIYLFGIQGNLADQLTVEFIGLCWVVGLVFQRIEWKIIGGLSGKGRA